ncbi:MAG TPA: helix-turn-helix domain-containing protein [Alloacidobacterium sp.]|nr:helix-turn-helix domain-containing protein [Alloacidobacterium sp.]
MSEQQEKIRCRGCELVQWSDRKNCRRCGAVLPEQVVKIVERIVEKVVIRQDAECLATLEQAQKLIAMASERLSLKTFEPVSPPQPNTSFPTMAEAERALILAAFQKSRRKPLEAARLLGIGKTTMYRKLREIKGMAA